MESTMFNTILDKIKKHDRIILHRHSKPDGDALGSQIGLKHILKDNFPEKEIYVDSSCCAGVTPETHNAALQTMKMCQINVL